MSSFISFVAFLILAAVTVIPYYKRVKKREDQAKKKFEQLKVTGLLAATTVHPHIDLGLCIGCGGCAEVCPEGDVIAVIEGKAALIHGSKCVGHGLCAEACPVGAITLLMAAPGRSAELPTLSEHYETNVKGVYIVGELGGMGLIKNAITQGKKAVEQISRMHTPDGKAIDVLVVGAGPAGLAAALTAKEKGLSYLLLEQGEIGGTILQYPRRKIVMTSPVEIPLWGKLKFTEASKESLLEIWQQIIAKTSLDIRTGEKVLSVTRGDPHIAVQSSKGLYVCHHAILALGRRGTPRKLGVPGESLSKVMYRLIEADTFENCSVLVVGGGDSAVEAAIALAMQGSNKVTLSYRKGEFSRIKERNRDHMKQYAKAIDVVFNSEVKEIRVEGVVLETAAGARELPNDYVFIFAGGEMPFEFLKQTGIEFQKAVVEDTAAGAPLARG